MFEVSITFNWYDDKCFEEKLLEACLSAIQINKTSVLLAVPQNHSNVE